MTTSGADDGPRDSTGGSAERNEAPLADRLEATLQKAVQAQNRAYAPYSGFKMGAAVATDSGQIEQGALVENVSLGLAMCAERVALFATIANASGRPEILALASRPTAGRLTWPCGACLQVALELGGPDLRIIVSDGSRTDQARLGDLAPQLPDKNRPSA